MKTIITSSFKETQKVGEDFARQLKGGDVLALYGDLGSGKTTFVQGLADALHIPVRTQSPTFLLIRSHTLPEAVNGIETLYHVDLYRLEEPIDIDSIGLSEHMSAPGTVTVIEWAEKMEKDLPKDVKRIEFRYLEDERREISFE